MKKIILVISALVAAAAAAFIYNSNKRLALDPNVIRVSGNIEVTDAELSFKIPGRIEMQMRAWFNENLESRNFYVPGVIATLLMLITLSLTSMAVVSEKER